MCTHVLVPRLDRQTVEGTATGVTVGTKETDRGPMKISLSSGQS